jgi:hypothetical protein
VSGAADGGELGGRSGPASTDWIWGILDGEGSRGPHAGHGNGIRVSETMAKHCSDVVLCVGG